jgi:hypothetical protein
LSFVLFYLATVLSFVLFYLANVLSFCPFSFGHCIDNTVAK